MKASVPRPLITMAIVAVTAPAFAQVQSSAMVAMSRTSATTRIDQPAAITSSQDLVFALQTPLAAALSIAPAGISSAAASAASATATASRVAPTGSTAATGPTGALSRTSVTSLSAAVPAAAQATFTVSGEAGQAISVTVPQTVDLARNGGGAETALLTTTNNLSDGPQFLGGTFAGGGTLSFAVGGQVTLASASVTSGELTGVMAVVAQYN
ncbi:DUF4402 domain-containing protein [Sphingoaurantiacus capsulatus]|uniref:DUF4402 domain-containing protein n=1 Tax=Sphingoaurantiacus capsulatus TaxID=1771310 RepID=A0ABV7XB45_9SPHN